MITCKARFKTLAENRIRMLPIATLRCDHVEGGWEGLKDAGHFAKEEGHLVGPLPVTSSCKVSQDDQLEKNQIASNQKSSADSQT